MKKILILIIVILAAILFFYIQSPREHLKLLNSAHLSATVYRVSNTILTATKVFSDAMDKLPLPDNIKDNYNEWIAKGFISPIKDQMLCGGCWAFATCGILADRLTIATNGSWYPTFGLSEQLLISCGEKMGMQFYQGCEGGIPHFAIDALTKEGVPIDSKCLQCGGSNIAAQGEIKRSGGVVNPNNAGTCSSGGNVYATTNYTWWQTGCDANTSCSVSAASTCPCEEITNQLKSAQNKESSPFNVRYKTIGEAHGYTSHGANNEIHTVDLWPDIPQAIIDANVIRMKKAIYYEGPISVGYRVTADFYTFWPTSSVDNYYKYDGRSPMRGGHAVIIVGWKKLTDGTPVWIIKNSWGENGGYGFPNGIKWSDPITGKLTPKYKGGFWNHIMGINDSFIESNAAGAHPNLELPQIKKYLPSDIPANWSEIMTLRDIYERVVETPIIPPPPPVIPPPSPVIPTPLPVTPIPATELTSNKFHIVNLTPDNITPESLNEFFKNPNNLYMIGSNTTSTVKKLLTLLPNKTQLSQTDVENLAKKIQKDMQGYIIIAARGSTNNYYYIDGDPVNWNIFTKNYAHRAATLYKFVNDIYGKFQSLRLQAPIVQISKLQQ